MNIKLRIKVTQLETEAPNAGAGNRPRGALQMASHPGPTRVIFEPAFMAGFFMGVRMAYAGDSVDGVLGGDNGTPGLYCTEPRPSA